MQGLPSKYTLDELLDRVKEIYAEEVKNEEAKAAKPGLYCTNLNCLRKTEHFYGVELRHYPADPEMGGCVDGGEIELDVELRELAKGLCLPCAQGFKAAVHVEIVIQADYHEENTNTNKED